MWDMVMALPVVSFDRTPKGGLSGRDIIVIMKTCGIETYTYSCSIKDQYLCKLRIPVKKLAEFASQHDYPVRISISQGRSLGRHATATSSHRPHPSRHLLS